MTIGLAVGIPLGVTAIAIIGFLFWLVRKLEGTSFGVAAGDESSHPVQENSAQTSELYGHSIQGGPRHELETRT
jgi:hypothetical protein